MTALAPLAVALSVIPSLPRPALAELVTVAIDRLDEIDGDPDEEDATDLEDEGLSDFVRDYASQAGPGCVTSDVGGGSVEDEGEAINECERQQMIDDVPCLQVFAIEPDLETGKRQFLGMSNLSPAFVALKTPASV